MPSKRIETGRRVLKWGELTTDLIGKTMQFWNGHCTECDVNVGICTGFNICRGVITITLKYIDSGDTDSETFYCDFEERSLLNRTIWVPILIDLEEISEDTPNTGRKTCWICNCETELRRDFKDMSVREFCPRCKI